jgi:hypothetical protein
MTIATDEISILDVEDSLNTALNATLAMHDLIESFVWAVGKATPIFAEEASTKIYMIGHCREMVRDAHGIFHRFLAQEFAKRKAERS